MTAERKIVVTAIAEDPFIIWSHTGDIKPIEEAVKNRKRGEDVFIGNNDEDLTFTVIHHEYERVLELLKADWKLDPFFHASGRPWTINNGHVWVLVKGSPEEVAELNPYVELPKLDVTEADQRTIDKFAGIVDVVNVEPEALEDGRVTDLTSKGWEVFNILKGSIVLVKREERDIKSPSPVVEEAVEHELVYKHAMCYLGVERESVLPQPKCNGIGVAGIAPNVTCKDWDPSVRRCGWPGWEEVST